MLDCHGPWTNDTPEEQASGQREARTNPQRKRAWRRAIRLLIMTGACGLAAMLADRDTLPTLRASAAQPYYVATITSVIHYCMGGLGTEENPAVLGTDCTVRSTLSSNVEGFKLAGGSYEDTMNASSRVPVKKRKHLFDLPWTKLTSGWFCTDVFFNVSKFLSQHPGRELTIWEFAENDSTTEFNMIYSLNVDQKHASDASASCHGQGRYGCQVGGLERLLLAYGVKGK